MGNLGEKDRSLTRIANAIGVVVRRWFHIGGGLSPEKLATIGAPVSCPACGVECAVPRPEEDQYVACDKCGAHLLVLAGRVKIATGYDTDDLVTPVAAHALPTDPQYRTRRVLFRLCRVGPMRDGCVCGSTCTKYICDYCHGHACAACGGSDACPWCSQGSLRAVDAAASPKPASIDPAGAGKDRSPEELVDNAFSIACPACEAECALPERDQYLVCGRCHAHLLVLEGHVTVFAGYETEDLVVTVAAHALPIERRYRTRRVLNKLRSIGPFRGGCLCGSLWPRYVCDYCHGRCCAACGASGRCPWCRLGDLGPAD
jgi:hypothetical protein